MIARVITPLNTNDKFPPPAINSDNIKSDISGNPTRMRNLVSPPKANAIGTISRAKMAKYVGIIPRI